MILTGYDYEIHKANEKKLAYHEGHSEGLREGVRVLVRLYRRQNMPDSEILTEVMKEFSLDQDEAGRYMDD